MDDTEWVDIPSDADSQILDDSEDEYDVEDNIVQEPFQMVVVAPSGNSDNDSDDGDDGPLKTGLAQQEKIWSKRVRSNFDPDFTENVGPKNISDEVKTPGDVFLCLFSEKLIDTMVEQSNLYCTQKGIKFDPFTNQEVKNFLGLNLMMGVKRSPSYRDYWSSNSQMHDPYISSVMPVKRFSFLLSHLHLNDNSKEPQRTSPDFDKLYKLRPLLTQLSETFSNFYDPTRNQAVDESMIKFKGRSALKQYMPMKPNNRGYKVWVRADEFGYVCQFQIYTGKTNNKPEKFLGVRVVKDLTQALQQRNYRVFIDNFFTTVGLMEDLLAVKILACGTVRKDRKGLPKQQKKDKDLSHGDSEYRTSSTGVSWVKWMDKKPVHFLSNFHDPSVTTEVNRKQKDGTSKSVTCPQMAKDYNAYMGCVDKADMLKSYYEISRKSKKWWQRIFWHFVDVALVNSFIIYSQLFPESRMKLVDFRRAVVDSLVKFPKRAKRGKPFKKSPLKPLKRLQVPNGVRCENVGHLPIARDKRARCAHCSTKDEPQLTQFYCQGCNVGLCIHASRNCFQKFHTR